MALAQHSLAAPTTGASLNPSQLAVVHSTSPLILAVAGPGSGKTKTLCERIVHLISEGSVARQMVCITFTNAAAAELQHRLDRYFPEGLSMGYVGTLHGFLLRLIEVHAAQLGYATARVSVMDEQQAEEMLERAMAEVNFKGSKKAVLNNLPGVLGGGVPSVSPVMLAAQRYVKTLRRSGLLSFDMILHEGLRLIAEGLKHSYRYLFVDEFQDSSNLDDAIYRKMPFEHKFFCGDPDQAIYGFRGGQIENIMGLVHFEGCETHALELNYRSGDAICTAAQRLISHNTNRTDKETISATGSQSCVRVTPFRSPLAEMALTGTAIAEDIQAGRSVAVLVATNKLVDEWRTYLEGAGLPVVTRKAAQRPADWTFVRNAIALLSDPQNDWLAFWFIKAKHGQSKAEQARLEAQAADKSLNSTSLNIPHDLTLDAYTGLLARMGASAESLAIVEKAMSEMLPTSTGVELLLSLDEERPTEEGQGVTISTIHAAKGREWDVVYLPAFEQEVIPGKAKSMDIEEKRRLAYVAVTRARYAVHISWCQERKPDFGGWKPVEATASQFIQEMGV